VKRDEPPPNPTWLKHAARIRDGTATVPGRGTGGNFTELREKGGPALTPNQARESMHQEASRKTAFHEIAETILNASLAWIIHDFASEKEKVL